MRFSELEPLLHVPPYWSWTPPETAKKRWSELKLERLAFEKSKNDLKKSMINAIEAPVAAAQDDIQLSEYLDPVLDRMAKSIIFSNDINENLLLKKANKNTLQKKMPGWAEQLNFNVEGPDAKVMTRPGIKIFKDLLPDVPCVIVCAGPSLGNSLERLSKLRDKVLIMATDTTFRGLMRRGIEPHFVNAHDANENGKKFFRGVRTNAIGLFVNYIHPLTIAAYNGPVSFYYVQDTGVSIYRTMALACESKPRKDGGFRDSGLMGGSSVAHTALYLAIHMGCNPITFVGLDLSYPDLGKSHFETDNPKRVMNQRLVDVWNFQGHKVKTNLSFYSYKTVFDRMVPMLMMIHKKKIFTSTEDSDGRLTGIVHAGLEPLAFDDFIARYATSDRDELKHITEEYNKWL
jgi:hypothetical protein